MAFAALQVPWVVRNYRVFGDPIVTTTLGGFNLYRHNGMIEEGKYHTGYSHPEFERRIRRLAAAAGRPLESFNEAELNALLKTEGARIIKTYPSRYMRLSAMRSVWIWYNENSGRGLYAVENFLIYLFALDRTVLCAALPGAGLFSAAGAHCVFRRLPQRPERAVPVHLPAHVLHDSAGGAAGVRVDSPLVPRRAILITGRSPHLAARGDGRFRLRFVRAGRRTRDEDLVARRACMSVTA